MFTLILRERPRHGEAGEDAGFTLIELLVVMIILGLLAAIAIPVFLNQRAKAHDSATKADVTSLGKEIATYFVDGAGPLTLGYGTPGQVTLSDGTYATFARLTIGSQAPSTGASARLDQPQAWCVALTDPQGSQKTFRYSALDGLEAGACS